MTIKGTVEGFKCDEKQGRKGKYYSVGVKVNGQWYNGLSNKQLADCNGKVVSFDTVENGEYVNIDFKSFSVSATAPAPEKREGKAYSAGGGGGNGLAGVKVGHAINNAVVLAAAKGDTSLKTIYNLAVDIIALGVALEGRFEGIVATAGDRLKQANGAAPAPAEKAEAPAPKAKAKAKAKPAPEPEPEPEPETEAAEVLDTQPDFDDDIPF